MGFVLEPSTGHGPRDRRSSETTNVLEDHVFFVRASLDLYQATGRAQHLQRAIDVAGYVLSAFRAPDGGFYDIYEGGDSEPQNLPGQILLREKPVMENALLGEALATLSCLTGDEQYLRETEESLKVFGAVVPGGTYIGPKKSRRMEEDEERLFLPAGSALGESMAHDVLGTCPPSHSWRICSSRNRKTSEGCAQGSRSAPGCPGI